MNKLREKVRKLIKPCAICNGIGFVLDQRMTDEVSGQCLQGKCLTCKGKGYIDELEFGCEVSFGNNTMNTGFIIADNGYYKYQSTNKYNFTTCQYEWWDFNDKSLGLVILGKPLELNELLEALGKTDYEIKLQIDNEICRIIFETPDSYDYVFYDLKLKPEQQSEEVINKLIEILS